MTKTDAKVATSGRTRRVAAAAVAAAGLSLGAVGLAGAHGGVAAGDGGAADRPVRGSTIVAVQGGTGNGFDVTHYDRRTEHLPTLSEAMAECGEYDARVDRVRCWTQVRTRYDDLGEMKRAIRYQKSRRH